MRIQNTEIAREKRARHKASQQGLVLKKSRKTGGFAIIDSVNNSFLTSANYDMSLEEVEAYLNER